MGDRLKLPIEWSGIFLNGKDLAFQASLFEGDDCRKADEGSRLRIKLCILWFLCVIHRVFTQKMTSGQNAPPVTTQS